MKITKDELYHMVLNPKVRCLSRPHIWHQYLKEAPSGSSFLEFGVWNGRSINYMADVRPDCWFYGFDSFEGLPENWTPNHPKGHFSTDLTKLTFKSNVSITKGWFNETIPKWKQEKPSMIAGIHVDCDLFSSTQTILNELEDFISSSKPLMLFDELFNYKEFLDGEFKAFIEFVNRTEMNFLVEATNLNHQQVLIRFI